MSISKPQSPELAKEVLLIALRNYMEATGYELDPMDTVLIPIGEDDVDQIPVTEIFTR